MASLWSRFFGSAGSQAVGVGLGTTVVPALIPGVQYIINEAWHKYPDLPLNPELLALGVVQGQIDGTWAKNQAQISGINETRWNALVDAANTGPGMAEAFNLWRRNEIDDAGFERAIQRLGLEQEWITALKKVKQVLLTPAELANARQQGFIDDTRQYAEAALQGVNAERAEIQFKTVGLPPGVETGLEMLRRNIIQEPTFREMVREGHTKTKYTDNLLDLKDVLLTPATLVALRLKGWIETPEFHTRMAQHGYSAADADDWYHSSGRPATTHQIHIGYARGASVPGASSETEAIRQGVERSNVRPEYFDVLNAGKYTLPSGFQIRGEAQKGTIDVQETEDLLLQSGWMPKWAKHFAEAWHATTAGGGGQSYVDKAKAQLWTRTHTSYLAAEIDEAEAREKLPLAGVPAADVDAVIQVWNHEREVERKQLTPAQIKKALGKATLNVATGLPWTHDEALAALINRGYSPTDAENYLRI